MTTLYRVYGSFDDRDKDGLGALGTRLLYVGITDNYEKRMRSHAEKRWWESVTKITRKEYATRDDAATAERAAIKDEGPAHNKALNRGAHAAPTAIPKARAHTATRDPLLSLQEGSEYLGICAKTLRRYISQGLVPAVRIKGSRLIRVRLSSLDALIWPIPSAGNY